MLVDGGLTSAYVVRIACVFGMASDESSILTRSKSVTDGRGTRPPPSSRQHDRPVLDTSETRNRTGAHYHPHVDDENIECKGMNVTKRKPRNQYIATHALGFLWMKRRRRRRHASVWEILDGILGIISIIWVRLHDVLDRKCMISSFGADDLSSRLFVITTMAFLILKSVR